MRFRKNRAVAGRLLPVMLGFLIYLVQPASAVDFTGGLRYRSAYFKNFGIYEKRRTNKGRTQLEHDLRADLGFTEHLNADNEAMVQFRVTRRFAENDVVRDVRNSDAVRIHQAYIDMKHFPDASLSMRLGRQELTYGREALVGADDWDLDGRSFDAIRLYTNNPCWNADGFYALVGDTTGSGHKIHFEGLNLKRTSLMKTVNEVYGFYLSIPPNVSYVDNTPARESKLYTIGTRMEGKLGPRWFYHWMVNRQTGRMTVPGTPETRLDIDAYNGLLNLDYFAGHKVVRNVGFEVTSSTGDKAYTPTKMETFSPLFPSNHDRSGAMDWWGMMNSRILTLYTFLDLSRTLEMLMEVHSFSIQSNGAAWYLGDMSPAWWTGVPQVNWPSDGEALKSGGTEFDFHWTWHSPWERTFHFGYSRYTPGDLLKSPRFWGPHGSDAVRWAYFQTEIKF